MHGDFDLPRKREKRRNKTGKRQKKAEKTTKLKGCIIIYLIHLNSLLNNNNNPLSPHYANLCQITYR